MPSMTLIESSKDPNLQPLDKGVILTFAQQSELFRILPFEDAPGGAVKYDQQASLPGVAFRGVNQTYTPSTGILNPQVEPTVICGGEVVIDNYTVATRGAGLLTTQTEMKIQAISADFTTKFIKGDGTSNPAELTGLQARVTGNQMISAGSTSGGAALSLTVLDEAIDATSNPNAILVSKAMARRLTQAARDKDVGGFIETDKDEFGRPLLKYNGLPIIKLAGPDDADSVLPFSEAAAAGGATATSIYVVSIGPGKLSGLAVKEGASNSVGMRVSRLGNATGELENRPGRGFRVEFYPGLAIYHGRAVTRVRHIGNLAIVK